MTPGYTGGCGNPARVQGDRGNGVGAGRAAGDRGFSGSRVLWVVSWGETDSVFEDERLDCGAISLVLQ